MDSAGFRRGRRRVDGKECGFGFKEDGVRHVLHDTQNQKWDCRSCDQQLCPPGSSGFGLPAEELGRKKKRKAGPDGKGKDFHITAPGRGGVNDRLLKAIDEVSSWQKQAKA